LVKQGKGKGKARHGGERFLLEIAVYILVIKNYIPPPSQSLANVQELCKLYDSILTNGCRLVTSLVENLIRVTTT
jgi:hypothetical protein